MAVAGALAVPSLAASASAPPLGGDGLAERPTVLRVVAPGVGQVPGLEAAGFDVLERRDGQDFFVLGDQRAESRLRARGLVVRAEPAVGGRVGAAADGVLDAGPSVASDGYPTFNGGYRTTQAQLDHLAAVARDTPALTKLVDIGDSWRKANGQGGHDMLALCITKIAAGDCARRPDAAKPRLLVITNIHAREIATPEIAWRLIDYLSTGYGTDQAVTKLLDTSEVWVVPMANPDGHDVVQQGGNSPQLQRKNLNDNGAGCSGTDVGTDLNRNFVFKWGGTGSGTTPCAETFRGSKPGSEPETVALRRLTGQLFRDRRGTGDGDAAPADTTGAVITYHSFAGLILYPWGNTNDAAPNRAGLRALATGMARYNRYQIGQPGEVLYNASGVTDDDFYGRLGVPSLTTELLGPGNCDGFFPAYSCVDSTFWPQERKALLWLGSRVPAPYRTARRG